MSDRYAVRHFAQIIARLEDGNLEAKINDGLGDLYRALEEMAEESGGTAKGDLTMKLSFIFDRGMITIIPDVKMTQPKRPKRPTVFWLSQDGTLSMRDPRQGDLPFKDVSTARETREVG